MPRWEGDGRERLETAALDLFLEIGYEATTVAAIAHRAGLTERSFYRHFTDKREVLFARDATLIGHLASRLENELAHNSPAVALHRSLTSAEEVFLPPDAARRRVEAISRSVALGERERSKLSALADALVAALHRHGLDLRDARLLTELGLSVFLDASAARMTDPRSFAELMDDAAAAQRRLLS